MQVPSKQEQCLIWLSTECFVPYLGLKHTRCADWMNSRSSTKQFFGKTLFSLHCVEWVTISVNRFLVKIARTNYFPIQGEHSKARCSCSSQSPNLTSKVPPPLCSWGDIESSYISISTCKDVHMFMDWEIMYTSSTCMDTYKYMGL